MADRDFRSHQRDVPYGDPEALAEFRRRSCRVGKHAWSHYKGGDHECQVCGATRPGDPRDFGAQTLCLDIPSIRLDLREESGEEDGDEGPSAAELLARLKRSASQASAETDEEGAIE
jgi:hypothetical protein